jgi:hypothetical protein
MANISYIYFFSFFHASNRLVDTKNPKNPPKTLQRYNIGDIKFSIIFIGKKPAKARADLKELFGSF